MKKIGNWWIPSTENFLKVIKTVRAEQWSCKESIAIALQHVQKFNLAVDVGTWIGDSTVVLAGCFDKVVGFEANPWVYDCCLRNIKDRKLHGVDLYNLALTNTNGTADFINRLSSFSGWVDTKNKVPEDNEVKYSVQAQTLDACNLYGVDFLKLDVDSHESFVLLGAVNFFQNNNPVILIEHKPSVLNRQIETMPDSFDLLKDFGYVMKQQVGIMDFVWTR